MTRKNIFTLIAVFFVWTCAARADVPPEPGYVRQPTALVLTTNEDLSQYRFFLESAISLEEVNITRGEKTVLSAEGHNGAGRFATLLAIPVKSFSEETRSVPADQLKTLVDENKIPGVIKVLSHGFQSSISERDRANWSDPTYRLALSQEKGVAASLESGGASHQDAPTFYSSEPKSSVFWAAVAIASIITFAFICIGGLLLRRYKKNSTDLSS